MPSSRRGDERERPSRRHASRSRSRTRSQSRSRSPTPPPLPHGAEPISDADYFTKNTEFCSWLKDERRKYFNELSGEKARSYFRKFVKAWNRGKLAESLYAGIDGPSPASSKTAYKWKFASSNGGDSATLRAAREAVSSDTYGPRPTSKASSSSRPTRTIGPTLGPTLPTAEDLILAREDASSYAAAQASASRKRARAEEHERVEDVVGPREVGREGMLEKKRAKRENDREFRNAREDAGLEMDEGTLMGGGDSFQARIAQRDAARKRFQEKRAEAMSERTSAVRERQTAMREKDNATMDMFKKMAKERFG